MIATSKTFKLARLYNQFHANVREEKEGKNRKQTEHKDRKFQRTKRKREQEGRGRRNEDKAETVLGTTKNKQVNKQGTLKKKKK